jgi:hypothetical protein
MHFPCNIFAKPLGCGVPKVVTVLAESLDVLRVVVLRVLVYMMCLKAGPALAGFAAILLEFGRPPMVGSPVLRVLSRVCTGKRTILPAVERP